MTSLGRRGGTRTVATSLGRRGGTRTVTNAARPAARPAAPPVPAAQRSALRLVEVTKVHGHGSHAVHALDRVSLDVPPGQFLCMVGASGSGKSTLLSLVAGLDRPTAGEITVAGSGTPPLMFQEPALFPWLTVAGNVAMPLRLRGLPRAVRARRVEELLETVHLSGLGRRRPHQLSGGMRQRVALARTLAMAEPAGPVVEPVSPVLLMDEPFGALDAMTRDLLHDELERIWRQSRLSVVFVTHNVREAARLGDRIVLLSCRPGRIVYERPVDIPRPRRIDSPEVAAIAADITRRLRQEVGRQSRDGGRDDHHRAGRDTAGARRAGGDGRDPGRGTGTGGDGHRGDPR